MSGLRIGVLGASRIAELAIICPAATLGHRIVAVAARDRDRAETFARSYGKSTPPTPRPACLHADCHPHSRRGAARNQLSDFVTHAQKGTEHDDTQPHPPTEGQTS